MAFRYCGASRQRARAGLDRDEYKRAYHKMGMHPPDGRALTAALSVVPATTIVSGRPLNRGDTGSVGTVRYHTERMHASMMARGG